VTSGTYRVQWTDRQAVIALPERIDTSNAGQIRGVLLALINQGATVLVVDMTLTSSCDHGGADAVTRAYQRAVVNGTLLKLVVSAQIVRKVRRSTGSTG
jgi:anti-anti-sigma regulatory factor